MLANNLGIVEGLFLLAVFVGAPGPTSAPTVRNLQPPEGMICVHRDDGSLFFLDPAETPQTAYHDCVRDRVCPHLSPISRRSPRLLLDKIPPEAALRYCVWAGKRLATSAEIERGAVQLGRPLAQPPGIYCAADRPVLLRAPYWHSRHRPSPPRLTPPTVHELETFRSVGHDEQVKEIEKCARAGMARHSCRDRKSYVTSNEGLRVLFADYIRNLGGGYVGIGADQAYDLIAEAKSRWAWLFDYDPAVVHVHQIALAVLRRSATPEAFIEAFSETHSAQTRRWIRHALKAEPHEIPGAIHAFKTYRDELYAHYTKSAQQERHLFPSFGWLANERHYQYVRTLARQGRILVRRGNLLTDGVMPDIARSARALGVPIRVYYDSNAADMWALTDQYRQNVSGLPFDDRSVALRTLAAGRLGLTLDTGKWIYVVHGAPHLQRIFRRGDPENLRDLQVFALPTRISEHLTVIGLPQTVPSDK